MSAAVKIVGAGQTPLRKTVPETDRTPELLAKAARAALTDAGLQPGDIDGLGVGSFTLAPDHAVDLAWRLGLRVSWLADDCSGGGVAVNLLRSATAAIEAGHANRILLVAGDRLAREDFPALADNYNRYTSEELAPLRFAGPNSLFAMLTKRHAAQYELPREAYGAIAVAQRRWAAVNPDAAYREPLTMADYLDAPPVVEPLRRYDCAPIVSGAAAVVVSAAGAGPGVTLESSVVAVNHDDQQGDGLRTGLADARDTLWNAAGAGPDELDLAAIYDDYPVMVLIQLADLGLVAPDRLERFCRERLLEQHWPLNSSGGMLSGGQAGMAGGMIGLVEVVRQLLGRAGARQLPHARLALLTGYGMVLARHGAVANAAILRGPG